MSDEESHPVDELKKFDPAALKAVLVDGTERALAVPKARNKWSRLKQTLDALVWVRVEALDKAGCLLGVVEAESAGAEDDGMEVVDDDDPMYRQVERMSRLVVESFLRGQKETRLMFESQMRAQNEMLGQVMQAQGVLIESYRESMQVQRAAMLAEAADNKSGGMDNPAVNMMLQLAMAQMNKPAPAPAQPKLANAKKEG